MPKIVRQRYRFDQIFIQAKSPSDGATYLSHFDAVREASAKEVSLMVNKDLRLIFKTSEGGRVDDPITITLELTATNRHRLIYAPASHTGTDGIGC
jgi:hypothetical protein